MQRLAECELAISILGIINYMLNNINNYRAYA
jgi:hypothetical protein